jgi:hypothetical protein
MASVVGRANALTPVQPTGARLKFTTHTGFQSGFAARSAIYTS